MNNKVEEAVDLAKEKLSEIHTVTEWAEKMGFRSTRSFSESFQEHFGEKPVRALVKLKLNKATDMLHKNSNILHYQVAREIGLANEQALYKFIKFHTGKTPSYFKKNKRVL